MSAILILYSSSTGQTAKIGRRLQVLLVEAGHRVRLESIDDAATLDLSAFDKIVLGARIRYGKHAPAVLRFVQAHRQLLESVPSAFFTVNMVARKPEKATPAGNPYLRKFLKRVHWQPKALGVFAGKIDYPAYGPVDKAMIRFIMWLTKGPTASDAVVEFTDWRAVEAFADKIASL